MVTWKDDVYGSMTYVDFVDVVAIVCNRRVPPWPSWLFQLAYMGLRRRLGHYVGPSTSEGWTSRLGLLPPLFLCNASIGALR